MNKSRTQLALMNSGSTAILQMVNLAAGFIVPRIMLTVYGSEINGLVSSVAQFIAFFNLVEAGLASAATYSLYKPLAEKDTTAISVILTAARKFYNQTGFIFVALVLGLAFIYPNLVHSIYLNALEVGLLVLIVGASGALEFFTMSKYRVLLSADQKTYILSLGSIIAIIINTVIIVVLAYQNVDIVILRAVALSSVFFRSIYLNVYVRIKYKELNFYSGKPDYQALSKRWDAFYLQIVGNAQNSMPIIIATVMTDLKTVSVYSVYTLVIHGIGAILAVVVSGLYASFGQVIALNRLDILQKSFREFQFIFYLILSWAYSCAMLLIMPFISIYTRGVADIDYFLPLLGILFVVNGLLHGLKSPQGMLVISAGLFKETRFAVSMQASIALVASVILGYYWGIYGIVIGVMLSNIYRDIELMFFIPKNVTKLKVSDTLYMMLRVIVCFIISVCSFNFLIKYFQITVNVITYFDWILYACVVGIYVFVMVLFIHFITDRQLFFDVSYRFKRLKK